MLPKSQFGFCSQQNTIHQIHRIMDEIATSLENKQSCPKLFLDIAQAFDCVWHEGLLFKLKLFLPVPYYLILKSYLANHSFLVRHSNSHSDTKPV